MTSTLSTGQTSILTWQNTDKIDIYDADDDASFIEEVNSHSLKDRLLLVHNLLEDGQHVTTAMQLLRRMADNDGKI